MKIKCDWCGQWINDFDQTCPNCGGVNQHYTRQANDVPKTIEELKAWAAEKKLPLGEMRTFIGEDYRGARAFGIYKDEKTGKFIVYKNKADGSRAVRYEGTDEAYAVNELYMKMKERVAEQKANQGTPSAPKRSNMADTAGKKRRKKTSLGKFLFWLFCFVCIAPAFCTMVVTFFHFRADTPDRGYYNYNGTPYYYYGNDWYEWSDDSWIEAPYSSWMDHDYADYYDTYSYDNGAEYDDFADSPYYYVIDSSDDDTDWDDGDDWNDSWNDSWDDNWDYDDSWNDSWDDWDSDW